MGVTEIIFDIELEEAVTITPEVAEVFVTATVFEEVLEDVATATGVVVSDPVLKFPPHHPPQRPGMPLTMLPLNPTRNPRATRL